MSPKKTAICFERGMHHENSCDTRKTDMRWNRHSRLIFQAARNRPKVSAKLMVRSQTLALDSLVVEGRF